MGLLAPAAPVWLLPAVNPKAKLRLGWELVEADGVLVGINANRPNRLVEEALAAELLPTLAGRSEEHTSELQSLMRISYAVFCLKKIMGSAISLRSQTHTLELPTQILTSDTIYSFKQKPN